MTERIERGGLWRSRWAALGAAVAVSLGAGGAMWAAAAPGVRSDFISITPVRVLDTRNGLDVGLAGPFVSPTGQDLTITGSVPTTAGAQIVVPTGATGVVLNVTVVQPTRAGFVSVRPADAAGAPATSSLNFEAGVTQPNAVTVQVPTTGPDAGKIELTYDAYGTAGASTDLLVDVVGYYAPAGPPVVETLTIPWTDFFPGASVGGYAYGTIGHVGRSMTTVGGGNRLSTGVSLPQGATITGVTFGVVDNGAGDLSTSIVRYSTATGAGSPVAAASTTGTNPAIQAVGAPVDAAAAVVDNNQFLYVAEVFLSNWTTPAHQVAYVTIQYTTT